MEPAVALDDREVVGDFDEEDFDGAEYSDEEHVLVEEDIDDGVDDVNSITEEEEDGGPGKADKGGSASEWTSLGDLPAATRTVFHQLLQKLKAGNRKDLTVLMLGKGGVGKSSTVNSLLSERVAPVAAFQPGGAPPTMFARNAGGFSVRIIDTPGILEGDSINTQALSQISGIIQQVGKVDVVIYCDRLDVATGPEDSEVAEALTRELGRDIWKVAVVALTRGAAVNKFADFGVVLAHRASSLREVLVRAGAPSSAPMPMVAVENCATCPTNEAGEKQLADSVAWLPKLMTKVVDVALSEPCYRYRPTLRWSGNPNNRRKWWIPLVLIAQVLLKILVLDRILIEDGVTGDATGPYMPEVVERERQRRSKAAARRKAAPREDASSSSESEDSDDERYANAGED